MCAVSILVWTVCAVSKRSEQFITFQELSVNLSRTTHIEVTPSHMTAPGAGE